MYCLVAVNLLCSTSDAVPPTQEAYESNESIINRIYLSTVARGVYTFTPSQCARIDAIANACPLVSGPCTFRARSLRRLYTPDAMYNDVALCHHVGISYRTKPKVEKVTTKPVYKVYPNPASTNITIEASHNTNNANIILIDILGRTVYTKSLNSFLSHQIDVTNFTWGIYHLKIIGEEDNNFIQKIIITH